MSDATSLANDARCFDCAIPAGMAWAVMAYILQQSIDGVAVSADPSTLANAARCYDCEGTTLGMIIKSLVDLNAAIIAGGGGGTVCVKCLQVAPVAPPDLTKCDCNIVFGIGAIAGNLYVYDTTINAWFPVIGGP